MTAESVCTQALMNKAQASLTRKFEYRQVSPLWMAYRLSFTIAIKSDEAVGAACFSHVTAGPSREGFAPMAQLKAIEAGALPTDSLGWDEPYTKGHPVLMPAELRNQLSQVPSHEIGTKLEQLHSTDKPLSALESGEFTESDLMFWNVYCGTFLSIDFDPLPTPLEFDYMDGHFCDGAYDLPRALEVLKADPRVRAKSRSKFANPEGERLRIEDVPSYNRTAGQSRHISFVFTPTPEDLAKMVMYDDDARGVNETRRRAVFDLDLLGLRAKRIARCETYGKVIYEEKDFIGD